MLYVFMEVVLRHRRPAGEQSQESLEATRQRGQRIFHEGTPGFGPVPLILQDQCQSTDPRV